jgi:CheY-like chemotaxis protein
LRYAQILWVDDNPDNNVYEREALQALGANTDIATSTARGISAWHSKVDDLVVSDMSQDGTPNEGLVLLREMVTLKVYSARFGDLILWIGNCRRSEEATA